MYCLHHPALHKTPSISSTLMFSKAAYFLSRSKNDLTILLKPLLKVKVISSILVQPIIHVCLSRFI